MGPDRNTHLRNIAIVILLALVVWLVPGGGTGAETLSNLIWMVFLGGLAFLAYRLFMEHRTSIDMLEDRTRAFLYGGIGLGAITLVATARLWTVGGVGVLVWFALLGVSFWALLSAFRAWRAY